jgi:hypothetical protein
MRCVGVRPEHILNSLEGDRKSRTLQLWMPGFYYRAVELIPLFIVPRLALAHLETPERAKAFLNKTHKAVPQATWIAAGLLEQEATAHPEKTAEQRHKEFEGDRDSARG